MKIKRRKEAKKIKMPDRAVIDDNEYRWHAFLKGLRSNDLKEVILVLDGAEPCFPAEAVRLGIDKLQGEYIKLFEERNHARRMAEEYRGMATGEIGVEDDVPPLPWKSTKRGKSDE